MRRVARAVAILLAWSMVLAVSGCGDQAPSPSISPDATASAEPSAPASASAAPSSQPGTGSAFAGAWADVTADAIGTTAEWTNKVELADIDADGDVDILFANGGDYDAPGELVASRAFLNNGDATFEEATASVFGDLESLVRVLKVGDVNADGHPDIVVGATYGQLTHLILGSGDGAFADVTVTNLPEVALDIGDLELGDVDADGDLDIALADWGEGGPNSGGGQVHLLLNDGAGVFTDATAQMPETLVFFSWDIELIDVDNDWDLDAAVSCKFCPTSYLFENDGAGTFTDVTEGRMPAFSNNYEFAPIDLDGDGFLDLVTINDHVGSREHVFHNDGTGSFVDMTAAWWGDDANVGFDDNVVVGLDVESDGDADFLIGSLDGADRLLVNDGTGALSLADDVFGGARSGGTLGLALADLNGDGRVDAVEGQGEVAGHEDERVYLATEVIPADSAPPLVTAVALGTDVLARVHDNRTPNMPHDWESIVLRWSGGDEPMTWYGENLFRVLLPSGAAGWVVCATDAAGNETCADAATAP